MSLELVGIGRHDPNPSLVRGPTRALVLLRGGGSLNQSEGAMELQMGK